MFAVAAPAGVPSSERVSPSRIARAVASIVTNTTPAASLVPQAPVSTRKPIMSPITTAASAPVFADSFLPTVNVALPASNLTPIIGAPIHPDIGMGVAVASFTVTKTFFLPVDTPNSEKSCISSIRQACVAVV